MTALSPPRRPIVTVMVGLPGAGKTRLARLELARRARMGQRGTLLRWSSDDQRRSMLGGPALSTDPAVAASAQETESTILLARDAWVESAIQRGWDTIVDDLNLDQGSLARLLKLVQRVGGHYQIADFTSTPLQICIARDAGRDDGQRVGRDRIEELHEQYLAPHQGQLPLLVRIKEAS